MSKVIRWTVSALIACTLLLPALSAGALAQDDAQAQLSKTASAMLSLKSFHFELKTTAGKTAFEGLFELKDVSGDVVRPSDFHATVTVSVAVLTLTLEAIGVDGSIWVKNPLGSGGDAFIQLSGSDSGNSLPPTVLLNPDRLVTEALKYLDNPQMAGTETLDGQAMTVITGQFDPSRLTGDDGTAVPELGGFSLASQPLDVKVWIDPQDRLARIDFSGPLFSFEEGTGRLVRSITFTNFDENITIQKPA